MDRFWNKVEKKSHADCWLWKGGQFTNGRAVGFGAWHLTCFEPLKPAHRVAYCLANNIAYSQLRGIPVKQLCGNKLCCNPAHLKTTTYAALAANRRNGNAQKGTYSLAACHA